MNTKEKGDIALGNAISYFMSNGYEVCLPIGDKRDWDIVVEKNGVLQKVQIKYAGIYSRDGKCKAGLRITGGNQSFNSSKVYSNKAFDLLFIYTEKGEGYCIPWPEVVPRNELTVEDIKYQKYKILLLG
jgi:hypothetical protein